MNSIELNKQIHQARYFMEVRQHFEALKLYAELVKEAPALNAEYARAAATAGEFDLAEQVWDKVRESEPKTSDSLVQWAMEYGNMWLFSKARELSYEAAKLEPNNLGAQINLASFLSRTNSVEEARAAVDRCLALDSKSESARYLSAHLLRRENRLEEAEQQFRDLLASDLKDSQARYFSQFELARVLDRMERYDQAMAELGKAKRLIAQMIDLPAERQKFDSRRERAVSKARALPKNILSIWAQSFPPQSRIETPALAFLGGHARSGTTLLEKILDAHPLVSAADEALAFQTIGPLVDVAAPEIPVNGLNFLRKRYIRNLTKVLPPRPEGAILLDKNPPVTAYLPAFLRVFPELRVLIALRDPRDVLVSCFFQDLPQVSHLSFESLAEHYSCIMDVWLAVREWEGLPWLETRYEDIVADLPKEGARVTKFLGLEWDGNQALFHEKNREKPVMTTNYNDVTSPVYKRAVGRWQAYERYMTRALPMLEPYCREFGYA